VLGPFDVGLWTLQGRDAPPADRPRRTRGRAAPAAPATATPHPAREAREAREDGDRGERDDCDDRDLAAVGAATDEGDARGATRSEQTRGDRVRTAIRGVAQTFITLGVVLLLFAAYEVWFTGIVNGRTQDRLKDRLEQQWEDGEDPVVAAKRPTRPGAKVRSIPLGDGFALIYIPAFGKDYVYTVVEGTDPAELDEGPGHYVDSALPGEVGNFAVAGHRVGKGSPFLNLDKLRAGSPIVIRTKKYWYTYRVLGAAGSDDPTRAGPLGIPGMQIVSPAEVSVVAPVPSREGAKPSRRLLTLTTCHPKFSARQRLVVHALLDGAPRPTDRGLPPALAGGGG
jgi:sortase A